MTFLNSYVTDDVLFSDTTFASRFRDVRALRDEWLKNKLIGEFPIGLYMDGMTLPVSHSCLCYNHLLVLSMRLCLDDVDQESRPIL